MQPWEKTDGWLWLLWPLYKKRKTCIIMVSKYHQLSNYKSHAQKYQVDIQTRNYSRKYKQFIGRYFKNQRSMNIRCLLVSFDSIQSPACCQKLLFCPHDTSRKLPEPSKYAKVVLFFVALASWENYTIIFRWFSYVFFKVIRDETQHLRVRFTRFWDAACHSLPQNVPSQVANTRCHLRGAAAAWCSGTDLWWRACRESGDFHRADGTNDKHIEKWWN